MEQKQKRSLYAWTGVLGILATGVFLAKTFVPLPELAYLLCCLSFGPLVVASSPGMAAYFQADRPRPMIEVAKVFSMVAGAFHVAMVSVQLTTLHFMQADIRATSSEVEKAALKDILDGVFTVQLGLCFCWDLFIGVATLLYCTALFGHGLWGKLLGGTGVLVGVTFLAMKIHTFPVPPKDAGLFDLGPGMGLWFLLVSVLVLVNARKRAVLG